jgi:hypothetical protein
MFNDLVAQEQRILGAAIEEFESILRSDRWQLYGLGVDSPFLSWFESLVDEDNQSVSLQYRMFQLRAIVFHSDPIGGGGSQKDGEALDELRNFASLGLTQPDKEV